MGGKGPAIVRYRLIMAEHQSYNYALGNGNLWLACKKLRGIAALIPQEYEIKVPDMPKQLYTQVIDKPEQIEVRKWLDEQEPKVYAGVNQFIEESYAKGELDAMI